MVNYLPNWFKKAITDVTDRVGFRLVRRTPDHKMSIPVFKFLAKKAIAENPQDWIVQIGANDGGRMDPLQGILPELSSTPVLLVEPDQEAYEKLVVRYKDCPNVKCVSIAVSDHNGIITLFKCTDSVFNSIYKANAKRVSKQVTPIPVHCCTLGQLLKDHGVPPDRISVFATDTEGCDLDIMEQYAALGIKAKVVQYEHVFMELFEQKRLVSLLTPAGYALLSQSIDTLATTLSV